MGCSNGGEQSLAKMTDAGELKEKKAMIKKAVIFDADGTLWDSRDFCNFCKAGYRGGYGGFTKAVPESAISGKGAIGD